MTNTPRYCRYCGNELSTPGDRFCGNCGQATEVGSDAAPVAAPTFAPVPLGIYESPRTRANWTLALFGVFVLVILVSLVSTMAEINLLQRVVDGEAVAEQELMAHDDRQAGIGFIFMVVYIALIIAFCMWIHRTSRNLQGLNVTAQRFSPGWAVGWWFVPIMNLFRPYQVVKEIWLASYPSATPQDPQHLRNAPLTAMLGWWWATWIASGILDGFLVASLLSDDLTPEQFITWNYGSLVADALTIVAALLAFVLVKTITANQEAKHLRLTAGDYF